jgi:hypothetical protein
LYASPNIISDQIKEDEMGHIARLGEVRNTYNILVGNPEGKRLRGRPRRKWEDNIKMTLWEIGWEDVDWMHLT